MLKFQISIPKVNLYINNMFFGKTTKTMNKAFKVANVKKLNSFDYEIHFMCSLHVIFKIDGSSFDTNYKIKTKQFFK